MSNYLGMEPDAVEAAGRELKRQSDILSQSVARVDGLALRAGANWQGRDAQDFINAWRGRHRGALLRVQQSVEGLGTTAIRNATEQRKVSSRAGGGGFSGGGGGGGGGGGRVTDPIAPGHLPHMSLPDDPFDSMSSALLDQNLIDAFGWTVRDIAQFLPGVSKGLSYYDLARAIHTGEGWTGIFFGASSSTASLSLAAALKSAGGPSALIKTGGVSRFKSIMKKNKVAYLSSVAISMTGIAVKYGKQVDWSPQATASTFDYLRNDFKGAMEGAADALVAAVPDFVKAISPF